MKMYKILEECPSPLGVFLIWIQKFVNLNKKELSQVSVPSRGLFNLNPHRIGWCITRADMCPSPLGVFLIWINGNYAKTVKAIMCPSPLGVFLIWIQKPEYKRDEEKRVRPLSGSF